MPLPRLNTEQRCARARSTAPPCIGSLRGGRPGERAASRSSSSDIELVGPFNGGSYVLSDRFIKENPTTTKKFVGAHREGDRLRRRRTRVDEVREAIEERTSSEHGRGRLRRRTRLVEEHRGAEQGRRDQRRRTSRPGRLARAPRERSTPARSSRATSTPTSSTRTPRRRDMAGKISSTDVGKVFRSAAPTTARPTSSSRSTASTSTSTAGEFLAARRPQRLRQVHPARPARRASPQPTVGPDRWSTARPITGPGLDRGVVFQQYALLPWRTAPATSSSALEAKGGLAGPSARAGRRDYLELVGLTEFADRYPHELSGGMKQRVAIARSLAFDPDVLLMDEPFAALDAQTRERLQDELLRIWRRTGKTIVFITHGIDEAVYLGQRVAVMSARPGPDQGRSCDIDLDRTADEDRRPVHRAVRAVPAPDLDAAARRGRAPAQRPRRWSRRCLASSPSAPRPRPNPPPGRRGRATPTGRAVAPAAQGPAGAAAASPASPRSRPIWEIAPRARPGRPGLPAAAVRGAGGLVGAGSQRRAAATHLRPA